jgi:hypothetical protein
MKISKSIITTAILASYTLTQVSASTAAKQHHVKRKTKKNLRSRRKLELVRSNKCVVLLEEDHIFKCEMDAADMNGIPNLTLLIHADDQQMEKLEKAFEEGGYVSGQSSLMISGAMRDDDEIFLPYTGTIYLEKN